MSNEKKPTGFSTLAVHAGVEPDPSTGAIMTPVYMTSTYVQDGIGQHKGYEYSRSSNPTRDVLEAAFAALEGGQHGLTFSSGLAAIDAVLMTLKPGDEVIAGDDSTEAPAGCLRPTMHPSASSSILWTRRIPPTSQPS